MSTMTLTAITHHPERKREPLTVQFEADGKSYQIDCSAGNIDTFVKFRQHVANRLGLWVRQTVEDCRAAEAKACWTDEVEEAF